VISPSGKGDETLKILRNQKGFTLIELVVIIVLLGILAAVAIPRFVSLQNDATAANNVAYVGALRSAISMRFADQLLHGGTPDVIGSTVVEAPATAADIEALVVSAKPTSLTTTAGACGTGAWVGLQPGSPPASGSWTLTCGASSTDPILITGP